VISGGGHSFGRMIFAYPTFEQMAQHWFDSFVLTPVLSRVLVLALGFDCAGERRGGLLVDRLPRMANGDRRWSSSLILVVSKENIIFGDNGRERVFKVSFLKTLSCVALVKPLGRFCSLPLHVYLG
jgi:hypothetical protein